jgi:hypothetical protein
VPDTGTIASSSPLQKSPNPSKPFFLRLTHYIGSGASARLLPFFLCVCVFSLPVDPDAQARFDQLAVNGQHGIGSVVPVVKDLVAAEEGRTSTRVGSVSFVFVWVLHWVVMEEEEEEETLLKQVTLYRV